MATSKSGSKASSAKSAAKKSNRSTSTTNVKTEAAVVTKTKSTPKLKFAIKRPTFKKPTGELNFPAIILAELIGTFVLTLVALLTLQDMAALYVGLTVAVLVLSVGVVSGAHLNPAVTFGLWAARKLRGALVPVYWLAQFVGAALAVLVLGLFTGAGYPLDFSHFGNVHWGIVGVELLGTAVFLFGLIAAVSNDKLSQIGKAFGVGLALTVGILVSNAGLSTLQTSKYAEYQKQQQLATTESEAQKLPAELYIKGATLNPAVALASAEYTDNQLSSLSAGSEEKKYSRLGFEVIVGTLVGAALGTNLYVLLAYINRRQNV